MNSINKNARMAGFLYFMYMVITIPADVLGRSPLIVFGDAATTARNIMASEWQFRIGITGDLVSAVFFLLAAWALYVLLKPVDKDFALLFLLLNLGGVAVYSINLLNHFAAVLILSGADILKGLQADHLQTLAMFFLTLHKNGYWIAQIFFGAWLFPLGYLVFKSGFLPRMLGIVLMISCVTWTTTALLYFLYVPGFDAITYVSYPLGFIAEFGLTLWLLIMGAKDQRLTLADAQ
jgi:Domain of unknown function (DUF4386)